MTDPAHSFVMPASAEIVMPGMPFSMSERAANAWTSALAPERVRIDFEALSVKDVFEEAGWLVAAGGELPAARVTEGLMERERLASTALGLGVALPHARIKGLKQPLAAFIRLHSPIPFDAPDNQPVADVFVLLVPEQATELHLQMLAEVAAKFGDPAFRERLHQQKEALAAYGVLVSANGLPLPDKA